MAGASPTKEKGEIGALKGFILHQSHLHRGLMQVFLVLFALLAVPAPAFDGPFSNSEFEKHVSAPAAEWSDVASLVSATLSVAEDLDEESDQDEAPFLALATLHCAADAEYRAADGSLPAFPHLSAHSCTGPPSL